MNLFRTTLLSSLLLMTGCAGSLIGSFADGLGNAIADHDDPQLVADALPAYLITLDALIHSDPENTDVLVAGTRLYSSYAGSFVDDAARAAKLANRARRYGKQALCLESEPLCTAVDQPHDDFVAALPAVDEDLLPVWYAYLGAWATWVQVNSGEPAALADLPRLTAGLERVAALDDDHDNGGVHLYLGVLNTQLPPSLGGKPEVGRGHFEKSISQSQGRNLMASTLFARFYARLVFDQALHDKLLNEVLAADAAAPEQNLTLANTLAQQQAAELLAGSADYF